ncbi:MAG: DUF1697 domain-containing protein [Traorella sp.]
MKQYVALLRGINVSGKNKIAMSNLKELLSDLGFMNVKTYLNSGNVVFFSDFDDEIQIAKLIQKKIQDVFGLDIPIYVISFDELKEIVYHAPSFWNDVNKAKYDNLIFMIPPITYEEVVENLGSLKDEYEKVFYDGKVIFWSFDRKNYQKSLWWKNSASSKISRWITIRNANTIKKIVGEL